jgi:malonate transporter
MLSTVLGALLPIVVTILLGFVAAWHHDFNEKQASTLNRMVLLYAVPMGLFAGTVSTPRNVLSQDIPLVIALCAAIIGGNAVMFPVGRFAFRATLSVSALAALAVSAPAVPFVGPAVLGDLFGKASAVPIGIASLLILRWFRSLFSFLRWMRNNNLRSERACHRTQKTQSLAMLSLPPCSSRR